MGYFHDFSIFMGCRPYEVIDSIKTGSDMVNTMMEHQLLGCQAEMATEVEK